MQACQSAQGPPETIYAVASGYGRSAIAVIRISGPATAGVLSAVLAGRLPSPRRASLRRLLRPSSAEPLDHSLVLWLPSPASFTGEDQAELHIHGGLAVRAAVLRALSETGVCRPAEPGEFTRRAFLEGKLDLTEVEGLADLIDAETEAQRRQAFRQLEGALGGQVERWRDDLVDALASLEAALDFTDEEDVPSDIGSAALKPIEAVRDGIAAALLSARAGERLRDGFTAVLVGAPNAGKSTLLNALARRDVAIVSPIPGTTRDAIEVRCDIDGFPVTFVDTAGLRDTEDELEREGVSRTNRRLATADLVLSLAPPGESPIFLEGSVGPVLQVATKADLGEPATSGLAISALTGQNMEALLDAVSAQVRGAIGEGADALITRERTRIALEGAHACLEGALRVAETEVYELVAEEVRGALNALGQVTGHVGVEDVLERVFARFCIGK